MKSHAEKVADIRHPHYDDRRLITAAAVRDLCGGVSEMSLWRWLQDDAMAFPKPVVIARRRYWREAEVLAWVDARTGGKVPAPPRPVVNAATGAA